MLADYQLSVGGELGVELRSLPGVTVEAVRLQFTLTGTSPTSAETVIRGVTPTQPTR